MFCFFFNDTATTEIYTYGHTLSLHDALPILRFILLAEALRIEAIVMRHRWKQDVPAVACGFPWRRDVGLASRRQTPEHRAGRGLDRPTSNPTSNDPESNMGIAAAFDGHEIESLRRGSFFHRHDHPPRPDELRVGKEWVIT